MAMTIQVTPLLFHPIHQQRALHILGNPGMGRAAQAGNVDGFRSRDEAKPTGKGSAFPAWNSRAPGAQGEQGAEARSGQAKHQIPPLVEPQPTPGSIQYSLGSGIAGVVTACPDLITLKATEMELFGIRDE